MKTFAIIGVAGYIATRHLKAIKDVGGKLVAAYDLNDAVGFLDSHSFEVPFFKSFEEFFCYLRYEIESPDYVVVCSPNYLHSAHIVSVMELGSSVICEKPLVIGEKDIHLLQRAQEQNKGSIHTILQLREHEKVKELYSRFHGQNPENKVEVDLTYITSRGPWYGETWKVDPRKSGGICFNIGVHFFDMLIWLFGKPVSTKLHVLEDGVASGFLSFEKADVRWFLSIDKNYLPQECIEKNQYTYRTLHFDELAFEFSQGFTDLHSKVYDSILNKGAYSLQDAIPAIETISRMVSQKVDADDNHKRHPMSQKILTKGE